MLILPFLVAFLVALLVEFVDEVSTVKDMSCVQFGLFCSSVTRTLTNAVADSPPTEVHDDDSPFDDKCVFCHIASNQEPARIIYSDGQFIAFHDINPSAKLHLLIIPRQHLTNIKHLNASHTELVKQMKDIGTQLLIKNGYMTTKVQQMGFHVPPFTSVSHLHLHVLGLPFKNTWRTIKYPSFCTGCKWYIDVDRFIDRLSR